MEYEIDILKRMFPEISIMHLCNDLEATGWAGHSPSGFITTEKNDTTNP